MNTNTLNIKSSLPSLKEIKNIIFFNDSDCGVDIELLKVGTEKLEQFYENANDVDTLKAVLHEIIQNRKALAANIKYKSKR